MEEDGGMNLYCFVSNKPDDDIDVLGLLVGRVSILRFQPLDEMIGNEYWRGWIANFQWSPPTTGAWSKPCNCKPCQQVVWTQTRAIGQGGAFNEDYGTDYAIKHGYYWQCYAGIEANGVTWDNPGIHNYLLWTLRIRSPHKEYFKTVATCTAGADAGKIYATVLWGYKWTYDSTPTGMGPIIE